MFKTVFPLFATENPLTRVREAMANDLRDVVRLMSSPTASAGVLAAEDVLTCLETFTRATVQVARLESSWNGSVL